MVLTWAAQKQLEKKTVFSRSHSCCWLETSCWYRTAGAAPIISSPPDSLTTAAQQLLHVSGGKHGSARLQLGPTTPTPPAPPPCRNMEGLHLHQRGETRLYVSLPSIWLVYLYNCVCVRACVRLFIIVVSWPIRGAHAEKVGQCGKECARVSVSEWVRESALTPRYTEAIIKNSFIISISLSELF